MRTLCFFAGLLATVSVVKGAAVTDYTPTRDTYMRGDPADTIPARHGSDETGRASKAFLDFYISDYDRPVIRAAIEAQLGHALSLADMPNVKLSLNFFSNDFEGYKPTALSAPAVFQGTQDWVEGTNETAGATKSYAVFDPDNPANNRRWKDISGNELTGLEPIYPFLRLNRVQNATFEQWGGQPFTYREWVLDDDVAFAYLTDPLSLGLFLNAFDDPNEPDIDAQYSNTEVFSRETSTPEQLPFLRVIVVPEPGLLSIVGLGALLLVSRRRCRRRDEAIAR
jgi:hypothetical protein